MQPGGGPSQPHRHIECPDRQILFHPVTDSPAHNAPAVQVEDDGKVEPAFQRPDIGDVASLLLVGTVSGKIAIQ